jgi:hypothetical protein
VKDRFGNELAVGQWVAWGVKGWLRCGPITELDVVTSPSGCRLRGDHVRVKGNWDGPGGIFPTAHVVRVVDSNVAENLARLEGLEH